MLLKDLATIQTGLVLSRKQSELLVSKSPNKYRVFTLSSLTQGGIKYDEVGWFEAKEEIGSKYLSKVGDIVIRLSTPNYSTVVDKESESILIPSQFLCIRNNSESLLSEYLNIYLNSDKVRRQIEKLTMGTVIKVLSVAEFSEIEIPIPPITKQQQIIQLCNLIRQQNEIKTKLLEAEQKRNKYYIGKLLRGES